MRSTFRQSRKLKLTACGKVGQVKNAKLSRKNKLFAMRQNSTDGRSVCREKFAERYGKERKKVFLFAGNSVRSV